MRKKRYTAWALVLLAVPTLAAADQEEAGNRKITLDEVVVTATRSVEKVREIPAKVEVVSQEDIDLTSAETLTEQLKKNTAIDVIEYPGALSGIGIRGFRPEFSGITKHSLVLINGRSAGSTNLANILSDNIERIEVLKGPASSLYGGEAMGGVVNIITKKNTGPLTGMAEIGFGSFDTNYEKAAIGGRAGQRFDFDLSARRYEQADDIRMGNGEIRDNTRYQTQNGNLRLGTKLNDSWRLDMSGDLYQGRDIETPGDIFYMDTKSGHKDLDRYGLDFTIDGKFDANNRLGFTTYKTNETAENYNHYTGLIPVQIAPYRSYDSEIDWLGFQFKDEYTWDGHRFIAGIDYQDINKMSRSYNQDGSRKAPYSPDEGRENWAGYLETIWKLLDNKLTTTAGARYDTFNVETKKTPYKTGFTPNSESFSTISPRAGLNYLFDQGIRLHTTIGKAFVPPDAGQLAGYAERLVGGVTMVTRGNPGLDPESSLTWDAGAGYELAKMGLSLDLTYFHTDIDDKITTVTTGTTTTYQNSLAGEIEGLEYTLSFDIGTPLGWERSLSLFINGTSIFKAEEEQAGGIMKDTHNVASSTVNYGLKYDDGMFDGKLLCRSVGKRKDTDWNAAGYPEITYPEFDVVDLVIGRKFLDHHRVSLKADNIFDEDYYEKNGFPKPGRAFFVSYRYEF